ncbi:hypothetical protein [Ornithinibacillus bavariensis]|uniref:DUF4190 domain-containing protein n=1 Tax=Ornithinibacillus bavariensis TaxID=545502 RepID=A0A919X7T4_9BACI|nr:hypothetical protein [Ornithinibacillus bavariensis]GIO27561.1 hypothetical protein J43TS3_21720 [Ornithinibacillus bavariensis]HAM81363.1 hypothetical protein [Ornithinibacillus sp.]
MDDKNRTKDVENAPLRGEDRYRDGYYSRRDEETAAELTADDYRRSVAVDDDTEQASSAMGWIALALSIASFFWAPILLGGAGIIVGFIARNRNANTLGNIAIAAGAISILITLFILPFV